MVVEVTKTSCVSDFDKRMSDYDSTTRGPEGT